MSRDQGPQDCCTDDCNQGRTCPVRRTLTTGNGGNTVIDGECLPRELPRPTNGGDWLDELALIGMGTGYLLAWVILIVLGAGVWAALAWGAYRAFGYFFN